MTLFVYSDDRAILAENKVFLGVGGMRRVLIGDHWNYCTEAFSS